MEYSAADLDSCVVDRLDEGVFMVDRAVFADPRVLEREFKLIFERTWVYLAHESQLPRPYDFVTGFIGRVPVILNRNKDGALGAFVNSCAHRGTTVCREDRGNSRTFVCPYHAWTYDADGRNIAVKERETGGYPPAFDLADHDLTRAAKVASYRGFVFASLNPAVPPLKEHLGDARFFIDLVADQSPEGLEVLRGSSRYTYRGNWKLQAENGVDGYHVTTVHASYIRLLRERADKGKDRTKAAALVGALLQGNGSYDLGNGHNVIWADGPNPSSGPLAERNARMAHEFGEQRAYWMRRARNLLLYPNVFLMDQLSTQIRVFRPLAVNETEVRIYCIAPVGEEPAARERRIRNYEDFFNASGLGTPDDLTQFEGCQRAYEGRFGRLKQPYDRGIATMVAGPDEQARALGLAPRSSASRWQDETLFHGQYRQWLALMKNGGGTASPNA